MQQAEQAKTMAMAQGEMAQNLAWNNRVQSMQDDIDEFEKIFKTLKANNGQH